MDVPIEWTEEKRQAVRQYFGQPGFVRFLALLRKKYEASRSGPRGHIRLSDVTEAERSVLDGFYGTYTPVRPFPSDSDSDSDAKYSIRQFEKLLLASRFALTVPELFEALDGEILFTRGEMETAEEEAWQALIRQELALIRGESGWGQGEYPYSRLAEWVQTLGDGTAPGFRTLRMLFAEQREAAASCLRDCVRALLAAADRQEDVRFLSTPMRLPVLSARITGDAHALDWKFPLGRLFWWGLAYVFRGRGEDAAPQAEDIMVEEAVEASDEGAPGQTEELPSLSRALLIREGYRRGGIADDDLSSQVLFFAPGWNESWEEQVLTLRQVEKLKREALMKLRPSAVYAVENPSVFAVLVDETTGRFGRCTSPFEGHALPLLVCGNGQPSTAVVQLLKLLLEPQAAPTPPFFYSGDMDTAGLEIARSLQQRFPDCFRAWRMDADWFALHAQRGSRMTTAECERMARMATPWDESLPRTAAASGVKLHQELWVGELAEDWIAAFPFFQKPGGSSF